MESNKVIGMPTRKQNNYTWYCLGCCTECTKVHFYFKNPGKEYPCISCSKRGPKKGTFKAELECPCCETIWFERIPNPCFKKGHVAEGPKRCPKCGADSWLYFRFTKGRQIEGKMDPWFGSESRRIRKKSVWKILNKK